MLRRDNWHRCGSGDDRLGLHGRGWEVGAVAQTSCLCAEPTQLLNSVVNRATARPKLMTQALD